MSDIFQIMSDIFFTASNSTSRNTDKNRKAGHAGPRKTTTPGKNTNIPPPPKLRRKQARHKLNDMGTTYTPTQAIANRRRHIMLAVFCSFIHQCLHIALPDPQLGRCHLRRMFSCRQHNRSIFHHIPALIQLLKRLRPGHPGRIHALDKYILLNLIFLHPVYIFPSVPKWNHLLVVAPLRIGINLSPTALFPLPV